MGGRSDGYESLIVHELRRQAREAKEAKEERVRVQKEELEKERKELLARALAESGDSKEEPDPDPDELQKAIDLKIKDAQQRKFNLLCTTSEHSHVENQKTERRVQAHRRKQIQGNARDEELMAEREEKYLQFREEQAIERKVRAAEKLKREVETKRNMKDNLKDVAARGDRIAAEGMARWEKAQVQRRAALKASRAGRYRFGFGPEDGILPGDRDPVPEPELPKGARGFEPDTLPPAIVAELAEEDARAARRAQRSRSGSPRSDRQGSPKARQGSTGLTSTSNSLGSFGFSLNPEVEISVHPKPHWSELKEQRSYEDLMRRTATDMSCEKRVTEARWLRNQRLHERHHALAALNAMNDRRTRQAAQRRRRVEEEGRRKRERDALEATRLADEARLERKERMEGIGKRQREENERAYLEHMQRKEGIEGLKSVTLTAGIALKKSMTDANLRHQADLQRQNAQRRVERNIARQRKYDERVKAELEAAGIDPMREQEEKTARIAAKAERAEERRKWTLCHQLLNPETGRPPKRSLRKTWSGPLLPPRPPSRLGPAGEPARDLADETANAGDLEDYILADGGPFDVKPPRDTLSLRPKWKNLTT